MHKHDRSKKNAERNPDLVALIREELAKTPDQLGLKPVLTFDDHAYNVQQVADQLRRVADRFIASTPQEDPWLSGQGVPSVRDQLWPVTNRINGLNPVTVCEAQWVNKDYPDTLEGLQKFAAWVKHHLVPRGCAGIETVAWRYNLFSLLEDDSYRDKVVAIHSQLPRVDVFSNHLIDQAVCDPIRATHKGILPPEVFGTDNCGYAVNFRAGVMAMAAPICAKRLGTNDVVHGFCGGAGLWQVVYDFVRTQSDIDAGFGMLTGYWNPILDVYQHVRCVHGLEVHGTEGAFDTDSFGQSRTAFDNRVEWGWGFDKSHLVWQRLDHIPAIEQFGDCIYHFHFKSVRLDQTGRKGVMRGLRPLGEHEGGWEFHTIGNGHDFRGNPEKLEEDSIVLNKIKYHGNVSCENEQPGAKAESRMVQAVKNVVAAMVEPGELHLPDSQ